MPSHSHYSGVRVRDTEKNYYSTYGYDASISGNKGANGTVDTSSNTCYAAKTSTSGSTTSHTHTLSGTASIALNVKYTDVIICSKN